MEKRVLYLSGFVGKKNDGDDDDGKLPGRFQADS